MNIMKNAEFPDDWLRLRQSYATQCSMNYLKYCPLEPCSAGVYAMSLEYVLLTAIALMGSLTVDQERTAYGYTPLAARSAD